MILKVLDDREYEIQLSNPVKLIIDAGANIGISSLFFAERFSSAHVVAIEPEQGNYSLLRKNCSAMVNILPLNRALWNREGVVSLVSRSVDNWAFSFSEDKNSHGEVETATISEILRNSGCDYIDILKLDIEGAERALFEEGCAEWINKVRCLIIELHDRFVPGCSRAFYSQIVKRPFSQEMRGENVFISFK